MKTALMFAHECAPYNRSASTIGAQRPAQFAKFLPDYGWRLIVICCADNLTRTANKSEIKNIVQETENLLENISDNESIILPLPSLKNNGFIDLLWYKLVERQNDGSYAIKESPFSFLRKPLTFLKLFTGDYSESWQPVALAVSSMIARKVNIDICIAEHGPDASLFLAKEFSKKFNIPWIADFRDPILRPFKGFKRSIYKEISKHLLNNAKATINVTPFWTTLDNNHFKLPAYTITNGFDSTEFKTEEKYEYKDFVISYLGSINYIQDIDLFLRAMKIAIHNLRLLSIDNIKFVYRGNKYNEIIQKARNLNIEENVDSQNKVPRNEAQKIMKSSHLLLLLGIAQYKINDIVFSKGLYPGKVFEYFACEKPILCVPSDNGILEALIKETNTGVVISDESMIADYITEVGKNWANNINIVYNANKQKVECYKRENLTCDLSNILNKYCKQL